MMILWIGLILCTSVIVYAGTRLSKYGDIIAKKTGLGGTWIGVVLLASVTSPGRDQTGALGFINQGGSLNVPGMLFVNRCTWAHILLEVDRVLGTPQEELLTPEELAVLDGKASPEGVIF
jgi:hypothetical protein